MKLLRRGEWSESHEANTTEEARKMSLLPKHPNRVEVHDIKRNITNCSLVMEYVNGGTLSVGAAEQSSAVGGAVRYVLDAAKGLVGIHEKEMIHRDIKPNNILYDNDNDRGVLGDFGFAASLTEIDDIVGTRHFTESEVQNGSKASKESDIYSLCATLCYLVSGKLPVRNSWQSIAKNASVPGRIESCYSKGYRVVGKSDLQ